MNVKNIKKASVDKLNIRKRLAISNILMIIIPILVCCIVIFPSTGLVWNIAVNGTALGFADSESFYERAAGTAKMVEEYIVDGNGNKKMHNEKTLNKIMDSNYMYVCIYDGDRVIYENGSRDVQPPDSITAAAESLGNECTIVQGEYCLYAHKIKDDGNIYQMMLVAKTYAPSYTTLKVVVTILTIFLIIAVILSVYFTNRFLTKFVFRKIEKPLDMLEEGVAQLKNGNLDYQIDYDEDTEFRPVCNAFNEMAQRLKMSVDQTLRNEQSRKELMAGLSHDIRSPLTSIQAYVEGLLDGVADTPEMKNKYLLTIKTKAENISNMVSQMFTFSKMELEDYPVKLEKCDIKEELEKIVKPIREEYAQNGFDIETDIESCQLVADSQLLGRICQNVLSNSLKYDHNEKPKAKIYSENTDDKYILHLADNGDGVDEKALDKLFDVFYRSDPSRNAPEKGSGLGLAIVANAAKRMNAEVRAENAAEGGLDVIIAFSKENDDE